MNHTIQSTEAHRDDAAAVLRAYEADAITQAVSEVTDGTTAREPDFVLLHGDGVFARLAREMWRAAYSTVINDAARVTGERGDGFDLACYRNTGRTMSEWDAEREQAIAELAAREAGAYLDSRDDDHSEAG